MTPATMLASPGRPWLHPSASTSLRRGSCPVAPHRPGLSGPQRHRRRACARTTAASAVPSTETTTAPPAAAPRWEAFAERAAGEWDGVTATFSADGEPQPLPDYYVPQAYRDWGVTLYDWQSQCSMQCDAAGLAYTHRRMMPTVGCEADAIAFTSQEQQVFGPGAPDRGAFTPDGSYSAGPADLAGQEKVAVEHCLVLQHGQRVRLVHHLQRAAGSAAWRLASIEVHRERWEAPYNGRVELTGCGGGMDPFAESKPTLTATDLAAAWTVSEGVELAVDLAGGCSAEEDAVGKPWSREGAGDAVFLPLGIWAAAELSGEDMCVEVGVLAGDGSLQTASRRYDGGKLSKVLLQRLVRST